MSEPTLFQPTPEQRHYAQDWLLSHLAYMLPRTLVKDDETLPHTQTMQFRTARSKLELQIEEHITRRFPSEGMAGFWAKRDTWNDIDLAQKIYIGAQIRKAELSQFKNAFRSVAKAARAFSEMLGGKGLGDVAHPVELWNFFGSVASGLALERPRADIQAQHEMEDRFFEVASIDTLRHATMLLVDVAEKAEALMPRTASPDWPSRTLGRALAVAWENLTGNEPTARNDKDATKYELTEFEQFVESTFALFPPEYAAPINQHSFAKYATKNWRIRNKSRRKSS